jgi:dipeptidyl aminopeptidase/acylaminoacyl peptidase
MHIPPFSAAVLLGFTLLTAQVPAQRPRITWADAEKVVGLADAQIAPDGRAILVTVSRVLVAENRVERELNCIEAATGLRRVLVKGRKGLGHARWSPSGDRVAFLAELDGKSQIFVLPMAGGEAQAITHSPTGVPQFTWSPDGKRFAFAQADEAPKLPETRKGEDGFEAGDDDLYADSAELPAHAWVISAEGGEARRLTSGNWSLPVVLPPSPPASPLAWSPDGTQLAYVRQATPHTGDGEKTTIHLLDVATGASRPLVGARRYETTPAFSPDGRFIAYWMNRDGDPASLNHVYLASATGGPGRDLTRELDRALYVSRWMPDGRTLLVGGNDGTRVSLWVQPLEGPARRLDLGDVDPAWSFSVDVTVANTGALAFVGRTPQHPAELYVMDGPTAKPRRLTALNAVFDGLDLGRVERVTWKGPEGQLEDGVLTFPPNPQPGRKLPLVLVIHGGPTAASGESFNLRNQLLAAEGFLVFNPNYRGSDNLGDAYAHSILNDAGEGPGRDVMAGIEALKAKGLVDATRMAVTGWSYGGYMTSWLLGRYPEVWRAGVAGAPVTDLHDEYALSDNNQAWRLGFWEGIGAYDGAKGEAAFRAQSPLSLARNIQAPTLILTMNQDFRVPAAQSYKLYRVLKDAGREVKFYAWPQRGHGPATPARQRQVNRLWTEWLTGHLK